MLYCDIYFLNETCAIWLQKGSIAVMFLKRRILSLNGALSYVKKIYESRFFIMTILKCTKVKTTLVVLFSFFVKFRFSQCVQLLEPTSMNQLQLITHVGMQRMRDRKNEGMCCSDEFLPTKSPTKNRMKFVFFTNQVHFHWSFLFLVNTSSI